MKLRVRNWEKFQHYRGRKPPWIKLHRDILDDYEFACLPLASRALAPCIWLLASESEDGSIDLDVPRLAFRLRVTEEEVKEHVKPLIDKGFLECEQDANAVLAPRKQSAMPEVEVERERETEERKIPAPAAPATRTARPDTWLTPYLAAWSERFPGSKPAAGKLAGFLAPLEKVHEPMVVLDHWRRYLERTEAQFVSPARFAETFPSWGPQAREPTNGNGAGRGTVGQRTMETAQRLLVEFQAKERGIR